ncbi:MAG: hypothetical protein CME65_09160 [Halobacteriovoraceae bacterium]|nr:hypothetical protein [Halobacteriovoraceae bacterium]|tara:strand:- start:3569 stop:5104 length:1536 start_codon:yes stop_codon:yes gene_type:complete
MKNFFLILFLMTSAFAQENEIKKTPLDIAIGIDEVKRFDYKFNQKIQVGNEGLLKLIVVPARQEITFRGLQPGRTSVTIRDTFGDIKDVFLVNVTSDGNSNIVREIRELLGDIEGIEISIKGGKVVVGGEIVVPEQYGRITTVLSRYPDVLVLIDYSRQTQLIVAREMQDAINRNNMKDVTVRVVNGDYWLEGVVNSQGKKDLAVSIADAYRPDNLVSLGAATGGSRVQVKQRGNIVNFVSVNEKKDPEPPKKLVKVSTQFVELTKDYNKVFAFKWAPFLSNDSAISFGRRNLGDGEGGGITTDESGTLAGTITRLFPQLNSAKSAGYARVIQQGMGVTNDGQQLRINKSTAVNFAVGTGQGQEARSVNIAFTMTTTPQIGTEENINLSPLRVTVSIPTTASGGTTPQVASNDVETNITVKSKESAVIGGVMQSTSRTDYDKDDPEGSAAQVPTSDGSDTAQQASQLFRLIRSKNYSTAKNQFVVFVTPEILESASKGTEEIRRKFRKRER